VKRLAKAIRDGLKPSLDKGGAFYEVNLHGKKGGFTMDDILIGYRERKPCPICGSKIVKIKTGSTSSFICPKCQKL
jgi:formamidopyrimidine-DNA glycosylase